MAVDTDLGRLRIPDGFWRFSVFVGVAILTAGSLALAIWWHYAFWATAVFGSLTLLGIYDLFQHHHSLMRNYPIIARGRWVFEELRPYLRQYIVESDQDGRPVDRASRSVVYARAKGQEDAVPFGTSLDPSATGYAFIAQSMAPKPLSDTDLRVDVGGRDCAQPYSASMFNISAMSFGSLSANAIEALDLGAKKGNFYHDTGEGSISRYHRKHGGDLVWEIGSGYFGCRNRDGTFDEGAFAENAANDQVKMIEIKISQGAKPGHGGMLPGAKVTEEIAAARGIPIGEDCLSPAYHSAFSNPRELIEWAARLRELSGGKPVGAKFCVGQPHEVFAVTKAMVELDTTLDFVVVDGAEGGTGAAPREFIDHIGMPMREGLILTRNALVGAGLREKVRIAAAGKATSAFAIASNAAIGADWTNAARAFMFTIGCVHSLKCHTGECPVGVATQNHSRQRALIVPEKAERVYRFHERTLHALKEIVAAAGLSHPSEFQPHHLYQRANVHELLPADRIYPFVLPNQLLDEPESTRYKIAWTMADTGSFAPHRDFTLDRQAAYSPAE